MKKSLRTLLLIILLMLSIAWIPNKGITVLNNTADIHFPETITFQLKANSNARITSIHLEYGTDALACGESVSRAIPEDFDSDTEIDLQWVWNLRSSRSIPPGAEVWWRWVLVNESGEQIETPIQRIIFLDDSFPWRTRVSEHLNLHWYIGSDQFANALLKAGEDALMRLYKMTGVPIENQVKLFIYASSEAMQDATLFAPDWSGGRAFPRNSTVLIGVAPSEIAWGKDAVAHELAHVVIGHYTFSCVDSTPSWIDEGVAMVIEGELDPGYRDILQDAVDANTLLSVRAVGQIFSADPDLASLSYAESFSLVAHLIEVYGNEPMLKLLDLFKQGMSEDKALEMVYGFDRDGLETLWRDWLGAEPMQEAQEQRVTTAATLFPTLAPIIGPDFQVSQTPVENNVNMTPEQVTGNMEALSQDDVETAKPVVNPVPLVGLGGGIIIVLAVILILRKKRKNHIS